MVKKSPNNGSTAARSVGSNRPRKTMIVVTSEMTASMFVSGFAKRLSDWGDEVVVIANSTRDLVQELEGTGIRAVSVPMHRDPHPLADLVSLVRLSMIIAREKPDVLLYATPKASLLASVAGTLLRVPLRIYQLWGLRLETVTGVGRTALSLFERLTALCSSNILANSASLASLYHNMKLSGDKPVDVLGHGSSHGVDLHFYSGSHEGLAIDEETAAFLRMGGEGLTVGFVGRIHPDKGVDTLLDAMEICVERNLRVRVVLVGPNEGALPHGITPDLPYVRLVGPVSDPRPYYREFDVLALPSKREGFPNVVLEAAAMGIPAIVTNATGVKDSVIADVTGLVVPVDDADSLAGALESLVHDRSRLECLGREARTRAQRDFDQESVWSRPELDLFSALDGGR